MKKIISFKILFFIIFLLIFLKLVSSIPSFNSWGGINYTNEDIFPYVIYNFSSITTDAQNGNWTFTILGINSSLYPLQSSTSFYYWINISSNGNLTLSPVMDNQTGSFNLSVQVLDQNYFGESRPFYFIINATNDAPNFTNISYDYNFSANIYSIHYINASDEENHIPLFFNISYVNCTHASWSNKSDCVLFNLTNMPNNRSARINYTPTMEEVGIYTINITVMDKGENYTCNSSYCAPDYSQNKSYSRLVNINIFADLIINTSNCHGKVFQENQSGNCTINITAIGSNDILNLSSIAYLRNYQGSVANSSWFYSQSQVNSSNFTTSVLINLFPGKTEVGNWTINFTVLDLNFNRTTNVSFNVNVNRTYNDVPEIHNIGSINTSIYSLTTINLYTYDDDFLIPDKNDSYGGYNETINITRKILNRSNLNQELNSINNFDIQMISVPVSGTNRTEAKIEFTPNSTSYGNYTINLTVRDKDNSTNSILFNLTIILNNFPYWLPHQNKSLSYEDDSIYLNLSQNVTDADGDILTFNYSLAESFSSFNLNSSTGVISFTSVDLDVGQHLVTVSIFDSYLSNSSIFNFTIYNINDAPNIEDPIQQVDLINASIDVNSNINCTEGKNVSISIWIDDDDFRIPQKNFYNESLRIDLYINGTNTKLFNFSRNSAFPVAGNNRAKYDASFSPNRTDVGNYTITVFVTDNGGLQDAYTFNLTVLLSTYPPSFVNIMNQSTAINRTLYYRINVTDLEDGNSSTPGNYNFTFSYNFLNGSDFIKNNQSIFNKSTGVLRYTFNSSQGGKYRLNISVNDTSGRRTDSLFWIYVYDFPVILYPLSSMLYSLVELSPYSFVFAINHSIQNNLSYILYIDNVTNSNILSNLSFASNGTNVTFSVTPDARNATYGIKNLTLFVYPSDGQLENSTEINISRVYNITIENTNDVLTFVSNIGGSTQTISGGSPQTVILSDHFSDDDASDPYVNQTIGFTYTLISTIGTIGVLVTNWTNGQTPSIVFSATSTASAVYRVTGFEYNVSNPTQVITNVSSNNFTVNLTVTPPVEVPIVSIQTSGGGTSPVPVSFKILTPGIVSAYAYQKIKIPLSLFNKGLKTFTSIKLSSIGIKDGKIDDVVETTLDKTFFQTLGPGDNQNLTLTLFLKTNKSGNYEILVNATSETPPYTDSAKIYINLQKINSTENETANELNKFLIFVEEFIVQNPQCLELTELIKEANILFREGDLPNARLKAEQALNACKDSISQPSRFLLNPIKYVLNQYLIIATLISLFVGVAYYYFKRRQISKGNAIKLYE